MKPKFSPISRFTAAPSAVRAAILATVATVFFAGMSILIRHVSASLHPLEIVFFRNLFALLLMIPWVLRSGLAVMYTQRLGMYGARAAIGLVGMICGFTALTMIPLTEATALSFTAPIFATVGAALLLGETVRLRRWTAIIIGFLGTMIILRPGVEAITLGAGLALFGAVASAVNKLVLKSLARTERPESIVTYMVLMLTPLSLIPALFVWEWPDPVTFFWLTVLAGTGTLGHICITRAFALAEVSLILPFDFGRLPFTALLAFLIFSEVPTIWTWLGGGVIFASTFYIARREAHLAKVAQKR